MLPCYIKPLAPHSNEIASVATAGAGSSSSQNVPRAAARAVEHGGGVTVLHLCVSVCAVQQELQLDPPGCLPRPPGKNYYEMDFGALPVGERVLRSVVLRNVGERGLQLAMGLTVLECAVALPRAQLQAG